MQIFKKRLGAYFQVNIGSFLNKYGPEARRICLELLKKNLISVLASDLHKSNDYRDFADRIQKKVAKMIDARKFNLLFNDNPERLLKGEEPA